MLQRTEDCCRYQELRRVRHCGECFDITRKSLCEALSCQKIATTGIAVKDSKWLNRLRGLAWVFTTHVILEIQRRLQKRSNKSKISQSSLYILCSACILTATAAKCSCYRCPARICASILNLQDRSSFIGELGFCSSALYVCFVFLVYLSNGGNLCHGEALMCRFILGSCIEQTGDRRDSTNRDGQKEEGFQPQGKQMGIISMSSSSMMRLDAVIEVR